MEKKEKHLTTFVLRSKYRKDVFFKLIEKPYQTQTQLLKQTSPIYRTHMSRTIKELQDEKLIECENPEEKTHKLYKLTKKGEQVKEEIEKYELE